MSQPPATDTTTRTERLERDLETLTKQSDITNRALRSDIEGVRLSVEQIATDVGKLADTVAASAKEADRRLDATNAAFQAKLDTYNAATSQKIDDAIKTINNMAIANSRTNWGPILAFGSLLVTVIFGVCGLAAYAITKPMDMADHHLAERLSSLEAGMRKDATADALTLLLKELRDARLAQQAQLKQP